ncbi:hypothetical protein CYMTET_35069, partial [Cymbomonas tetramitiformis]
MAIAEGSVLNWRNMRPRESNSGISNTEHRGADLPKYGELNVDFISYRELHLPGGKKAYPTMIFNAFMSELKLSLGITKPSRGQKVVRMDPEDKINQMGQPATQWFSQVAASCSSLDLFWYDAISALEVAVMFYKRIGDVENFSKVLYALNPLEQAIVMTRLGMPTVFTKEHCSVHFCLDCTNTEHEPIARELCKMAFKDKTKQSWNNIMVDGRRVPNLAEVESLWLFLTNENATPKIEIDFFGEDLMANKVRSEAIRCRLSRARQLHIY